MVISQHTFTGTVFTIGHLHLWDNAVLGTDDDISLQVRPKEGQRY